MPVGLAVTGLLALPACWVPDYLIVGAEWSDDDEMFAITVRHIEVPSRAGEYEDSDTPTRTVGDQIYIVPSDLSEDPWPITPTRSDGSRECLMSGAGYLVEVRNETRIVSYTLDGDPSVLFDIDDEANRQKLGDAVLLALTPSPNGSQIAFLVSGDGTLRERFFGLIDPRGQLLVPLVELDPAYLYNLRWTVDDEVFLSRSRAPGETVDAVVWDMPSNGFLTRPAPECTGAATTCGRMSEDGRWVGAGGSLDSPAIIEVDPALIPGSPFSCALDD